MVIGGFPVRRCLKQQTALPVAYCDIISVPYIQFTHLKCQFSSVAVCTVAQLIRGEARVGGQSELIASLPSAWAPGSKLPTNSNGPS